MSGPPVGARRGSPATRGDPGERISVNLSAAKGLAALTVMAGHFGTGIPNFWVVVTVGLLVFSISSGYFTLQRHHDDFSWRRFWQKKATRLIPQLLVIEFFLLLLFLFQGREGIWSWYTVVNLVGMNGFLNWFRLSNPSPYGAGMWFLTLLLLFYVAYPFLERVYRSNGGSRLVTFGGVLCFFALQRTVEYGHALWLTAAGFLVGMFLARSRARMPAIASAALVVGASAGMVASHVLLGNDAANYFLMLIVAVAGILFLAEVDLPAPVTLAGAWLSALLLEIYLLHPYLRVAPTGLRVPDLCLSIAGVLAVSRLLSAVGQWLQGHSTRILSARLSTPLTREG